MKLYNVNERGALIELNKLDFSSNDIYLVDDYQVIYIWIGHNITLNRKDIALKSARILNRERSERAKILLLEQNNEYGAFLAMMGDLKKGFLHKETIERRPELKLEDPSLSANIDNEKERESKIETSLIQWLNQLK